MTFRVKQLTPPVSGSPTLYMRADSSNTQGLSLYENIGGQNDEYQSVSFTPGIDYIKYLYIQPSNCNIEVKSIEILPFH